VTPLLGICAGAFYLVLGRQIVGSSSRWRDPSFALLNLVAVYAFFFWRKDPRFPLLFDSIFVAYVAMVGIQYLGLRLWGAHPGWLSWLAFAIPIGFLIVVRYLPLLQLAALFGGRVRLVLLRHPEFRPSWVLVGISYLAFRTSHLVLEVRNGVVPRPTFSQYLGFAFFAPTLSVGPISPYSQHRRAFSAVHRPSTPISAAALRLLVGAVKYRFLGPLLNQLTYSGLLLDGHPHPIIDLPLAAIAYYLYLYCNFSGFCDIAVGAAALMGIPVAENFANPFAARNPRDFWNRWHITLSQFMRDVVFSPLSKALVRTLGATRTNEAVAVTILVVFLLVGVWHGVGWNYAAFGAIHGVALVANHYYTYALKKRLGRERFAAYNRNRVVHGVAVCSTFVFVAVSLFFFANNQDEMARIFSMLRLR